MKDEESRLRALHLSRIRTIKRWMRYLPRRSNVHRYPVLKWFGKTARARDYLWSFRLQNVLSAIYAGCIITFMPLMGIQIVLAVLWSIILRANLPVLVGLQMVSIPLTIPIIYYADYQIGKVFLALIGVSSPHVYPSELMRVTSNVITLNWDGNLSYLFRIFAVTMLGGLIVGSFIGSVCCVLYRTIVNRGMRSLKRLRELQALAKHALTHAPHQDNSEQEDHRTDSAQFPTSRERNDKSNGETDSRGITR